jgi:uncharacterized protein (TIGR02246 family)
VTETSNGRTRLSHGARDEAAEQEIRRLHRRWFDATATKDLDAMMAAIADDVVSYEHEEPLRHLGVQAVREVCERGLDASADATVSWDVPDLKVIVRDDLAVAWGLDHVRVGHADAETSDSWSRGTRVFRRTNGTWTMIHQHLSVPYDPATGEAKTALHPDEPHQPRCSCSVNLTSSRRICMGERIA